MKKVSQIGFATLLLVSTQMSFAKSKSCVDDVACQQGKIEAMAESPVSREISRIEDLQKRLDGILRTQDTDGDAKMSAELELYQTAAQALSRSSSASRISLQEIKQGLEPIENRIVELERQSGAQ